MISAWSPTGTPTWLYRLEKFKILVGGEDLKVNISKCNVTGMLATTIEGQTESQQCQSCLNDGKMLQNVKIDGVKIPSLNPDEPYTYLGMIFTAMLN